jgi:cell division protein FtsQ
MDGGGRLDQPLRRSGSLGERAGGEINEPHQSRAASRARRDGAARFAMVANRVAASARRMVRVGVRIARLPPPGLGFAACTALLAGTLGYGAVAGDHLPVIVDQLKEARDAAANAIGFRIAAISLIGPKEVSREKILSTVGVTGSASLLFLDADAARKRLLANPWIADAAVLKLYPDRLQITITEREAFALWQKDGQVSVIAADGTILEPSVDDRYLALPLVVGRGAERQANDFLTVVDRFPDIHAALRASILVAERRWDLKLKNGVEVRLPEKNVAQALERLTTLDREKKLLSRDITAVDLRLPDRVSVRLSDAAAQARDDALREREKKKKKGGEA